MKLLIKITPLACAALAALLLPASVCAEEQVHYSDNFEAATIGSSPPNSAGWTRTGAGGWYPTADAATVNTQNHTGGGSKSMYSSGGTSGQGIGDWNSPSFGGAGAIINGRAEVWFYDDMNASKNQWIGCDNSAGSQWLCVKADTRSSAAKYCYSGSMVTTTVSAIDRTAGWHKVELIRDNNNTTLSLDGVPMYQTPKTNFADFNDFDLGSWSWDNTTGSTGMWFDDAKVVRGQNQASYRWFSDAHSDPVVGDALAAENTAITGVSNGVNYRLRIQVLNDMTYNWACANVALRYREGTNGSWTDLGASAHWNYANGRGTNGSVVGTTLLSGAPAIKEHWVEGSPSAQNIAVPSNNYGEWDFCITPVWANVSKGTVYYFKLVLVDGSGNYLGDLVSYPNLAQATTTAGKTWLGGSGGTRNDWNLAANWSPAGVPVNGDDVYIPVVTNYPVLNMNVTGANRIASISLVSGAQLTIGNFNMQIDGNATFNGTVSQAGTGSVTVSGTTVTIGGAYTQGTSSGTFTATNATMTVNQGATYTMSGSGSASLGNLTINGIYTQSTNNNTLGLTNLTINNGGAFTNTVLNTNSQVNIAGSLTSNGTMSATTGGNFRFSGAACAISGTSSTIQFWQCTLLSGANLTLSGSGNPAMTILGGSLTLASGCGVFTATNKTLAMQGNWTNNNAAGSFSGAGSAVQFTAGNAQSLDNGTAQTRFNNITIAKTAGTNLTASQALNIDGNFTVTSGNFVPGAFTHSIGGNWNDAGGGFAPAGGTITLDGASPVITTATANNFFNLVITPTSGASIASMGSNELDINNTLTISANATLNCGSSATNDVTGATGIYGTLAIGAGTTIFRGAVTVYSGGTLQLTTGTGAPTVQLGSGAVAGSITVNSGGTFTSAGSPKPTITRQGTANYGLTIASGATISINGLTLSYLNASGLNIANGATIAKIDNCSFANANSTCLSVGASSGPYIFNFCDFDGTANPNVKAPNGATVVMANATGARGASPNGEANDGVIDANITWTYGKVWTGTTNSNWSTTTNWSGGAIPVSTDNVVIPASGIVNWPQLNMNATSVNRISSLTVVGGATLNLNNGTAYTLQIDNNATFNGTVNQTTGIVNIGGSIVGISGNYTQNAAGTFTATSATMTVNSGATYTQSGSGSMTVGNLTVNGTYNQSAVNALSTANLTVTSSGAFTNSAAASALTISGTFTNDGSMALTTGGNFTFNGTSNTIAGNSSSTTFYNLTVQNGAGNNTTVSAAGSPVFIVLNDLTLTSGTLNAANKSIIVQRHWINNGGYLSGVGSTIVFAGGTAANVDNGTSPTIFQNVEVAKNAGIALTTGARALNIDGNFTLTSGSFVPGAYSHTVGGNWNDAGGSFAPSAGTITLDGSSPAITTASINNFYNLTISTSAAASMGSSSFYVKGALFVSSGTLDCGSGTTDTVVGPTTIAGTLDLGTSTTNLRGAVAVNSGGTLKLVTASGAPTLKLGTGATAGSITVNSGAALIASGSPRPTITRQGTANYGLTISSGATVTINGLNITYPDASGLNIAGGATIPRIDNCYFSNGTKYLSVGANSGSYTFYFCDFDGTANPNVTAPSGATITMVNATGARGASPNGEANDGSIDANITWSYDKVWVGTTSTNWETGTNWNPVNKPTSIDDILIPSQTNAPTLTATGIAHRVTITNGILSLAGFNLQVYGNLIIQSTGTLDIGSGGAVTMMGSTSQFIDASGKTFNDLTVAGSSTVALNSSSTVSHTLLINAGSSMIVASGKTLTLNSGSGTSLSGTFELKDNATLKTAGNVSAASGSTFKVSGISQDPGGYATIQNNGSGSYTMSLAGDVQINCGRIYNLNMASSSGLIISSSGGPNRNFANTLFYSGQYGSYAYMCIQNAGWDTYIFDGLGFQDMGGTTHSAQINAVGATVYMTNFSNGPGWVSGDASEIQTAGTINWGINQVTPVWSKNSIGAIKGGSIGSYFFVGTDKSTQELLRINPVSGATDWAFDAHTYGTCGMPTYIYSGGHYKIVVAAGNSVLGRLDDGTTELFSPQPLTSPGNPYASPDDATFYVVYSGNITRKSMSTGATISGWPQALADVSRTADPVVFNDKVYVGTTGGRICEYDLDGTQGPSFNAGASVTQPLLCKNSVLYVTPSSGNLYAVSTSNITAAKWSVALAASNTGPAFCSGLTGSQKIYVAAGSNIQRISDNGGSGNLDWTYNAGATVESGPIEYNGTVYFGRSDGRYYAIKDNGTGAGIISGWPYTNSSGNSNTGPWIYEGADTLVIFGTKGQDIDAFSVQ